MSNDNGGGNGGENGLPQALDLFCGAGGASMGLHRAGFEVTGIDNRPMLRYPFRFIQVDALKPPVDLARFDLIWASPPCQAFTYANNSDRRGKHPNLIPKTRDLLSVSGVLTCIENVPGSPIRCDLALDSTMFQKLRVIRRRHFELNFRVPFALGFNARDHVCAYGWLTPTGSDNSSHTRAARKKRGLPIRDSNERRAEAMDIDWTVNRREIGQAIPPAYSEFIGRAAMRYLRPAV